jgi:hypothetical protein
LLVHHYFLGIINEGLEITNNSKMKRYLEKTVVDIDPIENKKVIFHPCITNK